MVKGSQAYVRVLIRRPQADRFVKEHAGSDVPGLAVLDADGELKGAITVGGDVEKARRLVAEGLR